jgi:hypothetical protein
MRINQLFFAASVLVSGFITVGCCKAPAKAEMSVHCKGATPTTVECKVENEGPDKAKMCWDLLASCPGTTHKVHKCSKKIKKDKSDTITIKTSSFDPPIPPNTKCDLTKVENQKVKVSE